MTPVFTQSQFNAIKSSFICCYGNLGYLVVGKYIFGNPEDCEAEYYLRELDLILFAIETWQQNDNGSTTGYTNFLTQEQLNDMVSRGKEICGCC